MDITDSDPQTRPSKWPSKDIVLRGRFVNLAALTSADIDQLWTVVSSPEVARAPFWEYLHHPPFTDYNSFKAIVESRFNNVSDGVFYAIVDLSEGTCAGWVCLNKIEIGEKKADAGIFLPLSSMQRTPRATEAMLLMLGYTFEALGFERVGWGTDGANIASQRAAERLGFVLEQALMGFAVVDGKSRDKAVYVMTCERWGSRKTALDKWLDPCNFDDDGRQRRRLEQFRD